MDQPTGKSIQKFTQVTGVDEQTARVYLEYADYNLEVAMENYFSQQGGDFPNLLLDDQSESVLQPDDVTAVNSSEKSKPPKSSGAEPKARFGTIASLTAAESSDEEEGQAYYAGGSEHSGQQVLGPPKKKKRDYVAEMFKSVQEHGAELIDPLAPSTSQNRRSFTGIGYRLGQAENDSEAISSGLSGERSDPVTEVVLKLWKEGFSIDDGSLRDYSDPNNKPFLESLRRGDIPAELLHETSGREVHLNMEDHRNDVFSLAPVKVKTFSGKGHLLGSPTPCTIDLFTSTRSSTEVTTEDAAGESAQPPARIEVNSELPSTAVQVRLADGTRLLGTFNNIHTVGDLRNFIEISRPEYQGRRFHLLTPYPSRELADDTKTLADAGILNSTITQRLA